MSRPPVPPAPSNPRGRSSEPRCRVSSLCAAAAPGRLPCGADVRAGWPRSRDPRSSTEPAGVFSHWSLECRPSANACTQREARDETHAVDSTGIHRRATAWRYEEDRRADVPVAEGGRHLGDLEATLRTGSEWNWRMVCVLLFFSSFSDGGSNGSMDRAIRSGGNGPMLVWRAVLTTRGEERSGKVGDRVGEERSISTSKKFLQVPTRYTNNVHVRRRCKVWRSGDRSFLSLFVVDVGGTRRDGNADETRLTGIERLTARFSSMNRTLLARIAVSRWIGGEEEKGGARFCGTIRNEHGRVTAPTYNLPGHVARHISTLLSSLAITILLGCWLRSFARVCFVRKKITRRCEKTSQTTWLGVWNWKIHHHSGHRSSLT